MFIAAFIGKNRKKPKCSPIMTMEYDLAMKGTHGTIWMNLESITLNIL
jgi:hypothetical protein